jgi:hypothetical protein
MPGADGGPMDDQFIDAQEVYNQVWRFDFIAPGFRWIDCGPWTDSLDLRRRMPQERGQSSLMI